MTSDYCFLKCCGGGVQQTNPKLHKECIEIHIMDKKIKWNHLIAFFGREASRQIDKGENLFKSQHVHSVTYDAEYNVLKGTVQASQRKKQYSVTVILDNSGIKEGSCQCQRGLKTCGHMAALLLHARENISCTDISCTWHKATRQEDTEVMPISNLYPPNKAGYVCCSTPLTAEYWEKVALKISEFEEKDAGSAAGVKFILEPEEERTVDEELMVKNALSVIKSEEYDEAPCKMIYLLDKLSLTRDLILKIEEATRGQSSVPLWSAARQGRLTASNFGKILSAVSRKSASNTVLNNIYKPAGKQPFHATLWGQVNEPVAIREFSEKYQKNVQPSGLWLHECGFIGGSPDGLVIGEDAIIEVKTLYTHREKTVEEALTVQDLNSVYTKCGTLKKDVFVAVYYEGNWLVNETHDYHHQMQGNMYLSNRQTCYLILWTLKSCVSIPVNRDPDWEENIPLIQSFYTDYFVPYVKARGTDD